MAIKKDSIQPIDDSRFTKEDVFSAYKKLKHYFYYDNTSLFIRSRIASFETSIESMVTSELSYEDAFLTKMEKIAWNLNTRSISYWKRYFEKSIDYRLTPKSFAKKNHTFLTNRTEEENLEIERINIFIDANIEVHIISVLWLMYAGRHFTKCIDRDNYAYVLELSEFNEEEKIVNGLRLYKPYFIQYQNWRDNAIKKAEQLLEEKKDVVILSLDIKDYFHSVCMNLSNLQKELHKNNPLLSNVTKINKLFSLLEEINLTYTQKIKVIKQLPKLGNRESILPIGLLSSGLLSNIYLRDFDKDVKDKLNPAYYGRYVDDLLFVFTNVEIDQSALYPINKFIDRYFVERKLLNFYNLKDLSGFYKRKIVTENGIKKAAYAYDEPDPQKMTPEEYARNLIEAEKLKFCFSNKKSLIIQSRKVILQDLDHKESPAIINKFKKNLEKNRSEFRFLPDEDVVDKEFDEEAFSTYVCKKKSEKVCKKYPK